MNVLVRYANSNIYSDLWCFSEPYFLVFIVVTTATIAIDWVKIAFATSHYSERIFNSFYWKTKFICAF